MNIQVIQNDLKKKFETFFRNPKLVITYLWFAILFFAFIYALGAIVSAINNAGNSIADNKSLGFAGVWMMLLIIGLSIGGTLVMRKYQTPLAVGFFIGVVVMMSFNMFSMMVLFAGGAYTARHAKVGGAPNSDAAASCFSAFMSILYGAFAVVLVKYRHIIVKDTNNLSFSEKSLTNINSIPTNGVIPSIGTVPVQGTIPPTVVATVVSPVPTTTNTTNSNISNNNTAPPVSV